VPAPGDQQLAIRQGLVSGDQILTLTAPPPISISAKTAPAVPALPYLK
jgi:hypothetical protein